MESPPPLLEIRDLVAGYGSSKVLKGISLTLNAGEAVAVLGANGAGKTTLMKSIVGLLPTLGGSVHFEGTEITKRSCDERSAMGITLTPEGRAIFGTLSIEENLLIGATRMRSKLSRSAFRHYRLESLDRVYGMFPVLGKRRRDRGANLSGGQQQMLAIGRALMSDPKLLALDEPCLGLSPKVGNEVYEILGILREQGQSLIVVEESTKRALDFVDRACVLKLGEKVLDSQAEELRGDALILEAYFGIDRSESA